MSDAFRQILSRAWSRGADRMNLLSGLNRSTRTLYVGLQGSGSDPDARVDFELEGSRWGFGYRKRFSLALGQTVAINADGMSGATLNVIASTVDPVMRAQVVASQSPHPRDTADVTSGWWIDQYAGGVVHQIPDGAARIAVYTAATSLAWIMYDGAGVERAINGPAVPGAIGEVLGTHFKPGATFVGAFEIRL